MEYSHQLKYTSLIALAGSVVGAVVSLAMIGAELGRAAIHGDSMLVIWGILLFFSSGFLSLVSVIAVHLARKERDPPRIPWSPISWLVLGSFCLGIITVLFRMVFENSILW
jgi:hypothetical protein